MTVAQPGEEGIRDFDLILIGTGSAMNLLEPFLQAHPGARVAVIDKDPPGGICLTRGCIPTKILVASADVVRTLQRAEEFGIHVSVQGVDFQRVMQRMRRHVHPEIESIRNALASSGQVEYYATACEFVAPYTLRVGPGTIRGKTLFLCPGSRPLIPAIEGLEGTGYHTSDTILDLRKLPRSLAIIGGGYVAAEFAHFFCAMGSRVTILGRNPRFLPDEEPEVSELAQRMLGRHVDIRTGIEVTSVRRDGNGDRVVRGKDARGKAVEMKADEILVAAGRASNAGLLRPERGGIQTDPEGWIVVDEHLQASLPDVWAFGDANGIHMFKHKANAESMVVHENAILGHRTRMDYHAVPHAVFTDPEIASVGLRQEDAVRQLGKDRILVGHGLYEQTAKGQALGIRDCFVKVIVERQTQRILGAHIIGPHASILIQEIVDLMHAPGQDAAPLQAAMHIHPALSEVVELAFARLRDPDAHGHALHPARSPAHA
jgi:dihydrolipoamide dehydrogenase